MPTRIYTARAIHEIITAGEPYERHTFVCERLVRAFNGERPFGPVTRAIRVLAAPVPTDNQVLYRARNRGRLPCCPGRTPPLLWQLVGTRQLRSYAISYRYWPPPTDRPYVVWPLVWQIAATVGLTVLAEAGMEMWGIDLITGQVHACVEDRHRSREFVSFLKKLDGAYPSETAIKVILDNHSAHVSKETNKWLAAQPDGRFTFVFTPKHGSWLNLVEGFFSKMARSVLRRIRVTSKAELKQRIMAYLDDLNREPVVHTWSYKITVPAS